MPNSALHLATVASFAVAVFGTDAASAQPGPIGPGGVEVRGHTLLRDGRAWIPRGYYQIAFEVAPANLARADHPFWAIAQQNYRPEEYTFMRQAGADTVRIQIAQSGADPQSPIFDAAFLERALQAVREARQAGLVVIVSIQGEPHVPGQQPLALPDEGTHRVWREIAPRFAQDRDVLFELLNEPQPPPTPQNWQAWKAAMTATLQVVRQNGAGNVVIADGLGAGQVLDGAPLLDDSQVAYASHPYANQQFGQTPPAWEAKFGRFSQRAPVIITEWLFGGYFCNADTPQATVDFLRYLQVRGIGVVAGTWDWAPGGFGSARWGFPKGRFSHFDGLQCHQPGYGIGQTVHALYTTGLVPPVPQ